MSKKVRMDDGKTDERKEPENSKQELPLQYAKKYFESLTESLSYQFEDIENEKIALKNEKEEFQSMKTKIATINFGPIIKLNVGGKYFHTSLSTLTRVKSMLSCMFSGSGFKLEVDDTGAYFIDRSGEHFEKILNYFRTGTFAPPESNEKYKELKLEIEFYQIESLLNFEQEYKFSSLNDKQGIIYNLGTNENTTPWTCPVTVTFSTPFPSGKPAESACYPYPSDLSSSGWCNRAKSLANTPVFFIVNFKSHTVQPTSYSLSYSGSCCKPNNWKLRACNDEVNWVTLTTHTDRPFQNGNSKNWGITTENYYQYFQIYCDGPDGSGDCFCFHVGGFEIYGFLKEK